VYAPAALLFVFSEACFRRPLIPQARFSRAQGLGGHRVTSWGFRDLVHRLLPVKTNRRFSFGVSRRGDSGYGKSFFDLLAAPNSNNHPCCDPL
jgi:hypothetical protein